MIEIMQQTCPTDVHIKLYRQRVATTVKGKLRSYNLNYCKP